MEAAFPAGHGQRRFVGVRPLRPSHAFPPPPSLCPLQPPSPSHMSCCFRCRPLLKEKKPPNPPPGGDQSPPPPLPKSSCA